MNILSIALCAIDGGTETFNDIELSWKSKKNDCGRFWSCPTGFLLTTPSIKSFRWGVAEGVFVILHRMNDCLWKKLEGAVDIDGKTLRRSFGSASKKTVLHIKYVVRRRTGWCWGRYERWRRRTG